MTKKTGIIIPAYNEYYRLDKEKFCNFLTNYDDYYLCFVNDGSTDDTSRMLHQLKKTNEKKIHVIDLEKNQGKATAVQTGANYLNSLPFIDNVAFLDADLSTSLEELDKLVQKLNSESKLSMVFGSRKADDSDDIKRSFTRKALSNFVGFFIQFILQLPIKDTQCGAKVFKKEIIKNIYHRKFISKWLFDIEIFLRLKKHIGLNDLLNTISEEPLDSWIEVEGSKITLKDSFLIPLNLILIWINYVNIFKRKNRPVLQPIFNQEKEMSMVK
ncbi:glycosyltransferase [Aquimarina sp. MMG015]|uniref:glycosyltransferase n=1 Tax=Aquimarina sp. MMG015 TaxID=2822689 RepID=UPI001B3A3DC5|nr:glycosyltransferase [Aquimarina sp. MMG015]MBQ4803966.1 glycosyltransferase [Aquimarina sp. MMG015]